MSSPRFFGTDGIRGVFGSFPLDERTVRSLAAALADELRQRNAASPRVIMGGDTRDSTEVLCHWLAAELGARGIEITYLGTVPTPCVAFAVRALGADTGIAVSASHNLHPDNGIKLISASGFKWSPSAEVRLEQRLGAHLESAHLEPVPDAVLAVDDKAVASYLQHLAAGLPGPQPLTGLRIALDTGHGAAAPFASQLFESLGARVHIIHAQPNGRNINDGCGSTHSQVVAAVVREFECDLGFAFDGDADRVIVADDQGQVRDGDAILYLWAKDLVTRGDLPGNRLVATSMSNLGLEEALLQEGVTVVRCDVGDRAVVETMRKEGIALGGEQSGHIVNLSLSTTGDGLLTALQIAGLRQRAGHPLSTMLARFQRYPQLLKNLEVRHKPDLSTLPKVSVAAHRVEEQLGSNGRLVLRYSGTEPKVRIMIEGKKRQEIEALANDLAEVLIAELG